MSTGATAYNSGSAGAESAGTKRKRPAHNWADNDDDEGAGGSGAGSQPLPMSPVVLLDLSPHHELAARLWPEPLASYRWSVYSLAYAVVIGRGSGIGSIGNMDINEVAGIMDLSSSPARGSSGAYSQPSDVQLTYDTVNIRSPGDPVLQDALRAVSSCADGGPPMEASIGPADFIVGVRQVRDSDMQVWRGQRMMSATTKHDFHYSAEQRPAASLRARHPALGDSRRWPTYAPVVLHKIDKAAVKAATGGVPGCPGGLCVPIDYRQLRLMPHAAVVAAVRSIESAARVAMEPTTAWSSSAGSASSTSGRPVYMQLTVLRYDKSGASEEHARKSIARGAAAVKPAPALPLPMPKPTSSATSTVPSAPSASQPAARNPWAAAFPTADDVEKIVEAAIAQQDKLKSVSAAAVDRAPGSSAHAVARTMAVAAASGSPSSPLDLPLHFTEAELSSGWSGVHVRLRTSAVGSASSLREGRSARLPTSVLEGILGRRHAGGVAGAIVHSAGGGSKGTANVGAATSAGKASKSRPLAAASVVLVPLPAPAKGLLAPAPAPKQAPAQIECLLCFEELSPMPGAIRSSYRFTCCTGAAASNYFCWSCLQNPGMLPRPLERCESCRKSVAGVAKVVLHEDSNASNAIKGKPAQLAAFNKSLNSAPSKGGPSPSRAGGAAGQVQCSFCGNLVQGAVVHKCDTCGEGYCRSQCKVYATMEGSHKRGCPASGGTGSGSGAAGQGAAGGVGSGSSGQTSMQAMMAAVLAAHVARSSTQGSGAKKG